MDNQNPWQPSDQGGSSEPHSSPPAAPYAPPAQDQPYGPPAQQPYAPPGDPYAQPGYGPPGGYPPPPPPSQRKQGFNWLMCCGIGCGVLLLVTIIAVLVVGKSCGGFFGPIMEIAKVAGEVSAVDAATIKSGASAVDAGTLTASPDAYKGQWIALEGVLGDESNEMA